MLFRSEALDATGDPAIKRRRFGSKFRLDVVPSSEPMVYEIGRASCRERVFPVV